MASHRAKTTVGGFLSVAVVFVLLAVLNGALSAAGQWSFDHAPKFWPRRSSSDDLVFKVETDRTKLNIHTGTWTVPLTTKLPKFESNCLGLDIWAVRAAGVVDMYPAVRVAVTGNSSVDVVIQRIYPEIISVESESNFRKVSCPVGGPLGVDTASISLANPGRTDYTDERGNAVRNFAYSLSKGEVAQFLVTRSYADEAKKGMVMWNLMLDYTVGKDSHTINLNDYQHIAPFRTPNECDATDSLQWVGTWQGGGGTNRQCSKVH